MITERGPAAAYDAVTGPELLIKTYDQPGPHGAAQLLVPTTDHHPTATEIHSAPR